MKFIFVILMILVTGWALGYLKVEPTRESVEMGDFDLKVPDKE